MQHFGGGGGFYLSSSAVSARLTIGVKYFKILNMIFEYFTGSPPLPASDDLNNKMECSSAAEVFISLLQKRGCQCTILQHIPTSKTSRKLKMYS